MMKLKTLMPALLALLIAMLAAPVAAAESQKILLDDAVSLALERNAELLPAKYDVELARLDLQSAEADAALAPNPTQLRQRRLALQTAEENYANLKKKIERETRRMAFDILSKEQTVELNRRKYEQALNDRETTKLKVDLNMESAVSLLTAERNVISAQQALNNSITSLDIARMNFLKHIGDPDVTRLFTLEIPDFELTLETWEEAKAVEQALAYTAKMVSARNSLEAAELELKLNSAEFTPAASKRRYEIALEKARLTLAEEAKNVRIQVRQFISDIAALHQDLAAAEIAVQIAAEQYAATKIKHEQGMITDAQLAAQENNLMQAKQSLLDTKFRVRDKQQDFRDYLAL